MQNYNLCSKDWQCIVNFLTERNEKPEAGSPKPEGRRWKKESR